MTIQELEARLEDLSRDEKGHLFRRLAVDLMPEWPGIEKTPGVQGGDACIVRTRIPVWTLEAYRRLGWDDAQILANFPTLRPVDLILAWLYVDANPEEIEQALQEQETA
ncbi:MAG TPA: DUF433 domain-containing protein [Herpetosiphonaceae bacterium]|nr:DUF433 domain-containing protein [Herpetosiphonaceae bacterium]